MATYKKRPKIDPRTINTWWKPAYDTVIALHVIGKSNKEIVQTVKGISMATIVNVLTSDTGKIKIQEYSGLYHENLVKDEANKLNEIRATAIDNVHGIITDEEFKKKKTPAVLEASFKAFEFANDAIRGVEKNREQNTQNIQNQQINVILGNKEYADRLMKGLELVNEIDKRRIEK